MSKCYQRETKAERIIQRGLEDPSLPENSYPLWESHEDCVGSTSVHLGEGTKTTMKMEPHILVSSPILWNAEGWKQERWEHFFSFKQDEMSFWIQGNLENEPSCRIIIGHKELFPGSIHGFLWADHDQVCSLLLLLFSGDFCESAGKFGRDCMRFGVTYLLNEKRNIYESYHCKEKDKEFKAKAETSLPTVVHNTLVETIRVVGLLSWESTLTDYVKLSDGHE